MKKTNFYIGFLLMCLTVFVSCDKEDKEDTPDPQELIADFSQATVYDYSLNPEGNPIYSDFSGILTRSADFDGENVLIVSRDGGNMVKLLKLTDIVAGTVTSPTLLSNTGIAGGTFGISSGRVAHKRVYVSNLASIKAANFKIYYWANATSDPEMICDIDAASIGLQDVTGSDDRFGDNLSVDIDTNGNGYIFAVNNTGNIILRLKVSNFNTIEEKMIFPANTLMPIYGSVNRIANTDQYVLTSTRAAVTLIDKDATELMKLTGNNVPTEAVDARIIDFNWGRYLITTTGRWTSTTTPQTLYVYDLTEGKDIEEALDLFDKEAHTPIYSFSLNGTGSTAASANCNWAVVGNDLYLFAAAPQAGFTVVKVPRK